MSYGGFTFNKIQLGRESVPGTVVPATIVWRGQMAMIEDARVIKVIEEQVGLQVPTERSYTSMLLAKLQFPQAELTFEQLPHILEAGMGIVTPTGSGPYVRSYGFATGIVPNTIKTYTIEAGNTLVPGDTQKMEYSYVEEFELSGKYGEAWMMSSNWIGRQLTQAAFTGSLALPNVEAALFPMTKLYIDPTGGTIGTTQKQGVLMSAKFRVRTGIVYIPVGDGNLYFYGHKLTPPSVNFSISLELESGGIVAAERAAWASQAVRLFQLKTPGSSSAKEFDISLAGKYDKIGGYENQQGNTVVTFDGHAVLSSADSLYFKTDITNSVATL